MCVVVVVFVVVVVVFVVVLAVVLRSCCLFESKCWYLLMLCIQTVLFMLVFVAL